MYTRFYTDIKIWRRYMYMGNVYSTLALGKERKGTSERRNSLRKERKKQYICTCMFHIAGIICSLL